VRVGVLLLLAILAGFAGQSLAAAETPVGNPAGQPFRFVVLGHIRGDGHGLNPKLAEVLEEVRRVKPEAVFLAGDIVWGDYNSRHTDSLSVEAEWQEVDSALATLGVPVYRVPGNHDINDAVTRNIWVRRYGTLPQAVTQGGQRFLLLASGWVPEQGDTGKALYIRGRDLDEKQIAFLRHELAMPSDSGRTFVIMHHLLWWAPDSAQWWQQVHPVLASARTAAVFTGDYGPLKFSSLERDEVHYYQTSIEGDVPVQMQRDLLSSRLLSSQFDNFLVATVEGQTVSVEVRVAAALSSGQFTPVHWREINESPRPRPSFWQRIWEVVGSPKRLLALGVFTGLVFWFGWRLGRYPRRLV
jgi:predicted phosphodiesterase